MCLLTRPAAPPPQYSDERADAPASEALSRVGQGRLAAASGVRDRPSISGSDGAEAPCSAPSSPQPALSPWERVFGGAGLRLLARRSMRSAVRVRVSATEASLA